MNSKEEWRDIVGYEGLYQVSNYGRVKSLPRKWMRKEKIKRLCGQRRGCASYNQTSLYKNGKGTSFLVHRLVAIAFIPNPMNLPEVNHKNGIKSDNEIDNLEWCTKSQNELHANRIGLKRRCGLYGESHYFTPFKNEDILEIRRSYADDNVSMPEIARKYNVSFGAIWNIVRRNTWKHI